jgi:ElaB/YqjD/DUF883 family membrane-anchored ribosome-binding protein
MSSPTVKKDQAQQHAEQARTSAGQAVDKAREGFGQAADKARDAASHAGESLKDSAQGVGQAVAHKADQATAAVGSGMHSLAETVRQHTPESGMLGSASHSVADTLDQTGRYIEDRQLSGMMEDLTGLVRRNPIPAVLIGLGVGFLLGRALRSR